MKNSFVIAFFFALISCNQQNTDVDQMQAKIDSLQKQMNESYKPGFGEFMSSIQVHHAKLWFAGLNQNWDLADFEIHEMEEALENVQKFNTERTEAKSIEMINPAMDSVRNAVKKKDISFFRTSYNLLTTECNKCHQATDHGFNVVTIPTTPPVSNQSFKLVQ